MFGLARYRCSRSFAIDNGKLNIYCIVVEEERAVSAIKSCLKTYRLDLTHAIIAARNWMMKALG